jgi:hypothetical protein
MTEANIHGNGSFDVGGNPTTDPDAFIDFGD